MSYSPDRAFTDFIHQQLALPIIYERLGWKPIMLPTQQAISMDMDHGIDYVFEQPSGKIVAVQERFREVKYKDFADFTIRYRRDTNKILQRQESEYYKMKSDFFVYGITNGWKKNIEGITNFEKYAVINMAGVYRKIEEGFIQIQDNGRNHCSLTGNNIICPVKYNQDGSSSFFPVDIRYLARLWGTDLIVAQKGFLEAIS